MNPTCERLEVTGALAGNADSRRRRDVDIEVGGILWDPAAQPKRPFLEQIWRGVGNQERLNDFVRRQARAALRGQ